MKYLNDNWRYRYRDESDEGSSGLMEDESLDDDTPDYDEEQIASLNLNDEQKAEYEKTGKFELTDEQQAIASEFNKPPERP